MECHVAGRQYHDANDVWDKLTIGTELYLERDIENRYDPYAVAILYRDPNTEDEFLIGYVPKGENQTISMFLEMGHTNIFECRLSKKNEDTHPENQLRVTIKIKRSE